MTNKAALESYQLFKVYLTHSVPSLYQKNGVKYICVYTKLFSSFP